MKKILICVLMLAVLVTAFVSCKEEETAPDLTALNNAKSYLEAQYRDANDMGADYERTTVLPGNCTVAWSVNVTSGNAEDVKVGEAADGKVVIDINEVASVDTVYTLIATITDANGNSTTVEFAYTVAKTSVITVAEFLAKSTDDKTEYAIEGYVMASAASATKGASFVVADNTGAIFSYEKFIVAKGDKVIVKGSRSDNYGVPQIKTTAVSIVEANSTGYAEATATELAASAIDLDNLKKETIGAMTGIYYKVTGATLVKNSSGYTNAELNGKEMLQLYPSDALVAEIGDLYGETVNVYGYVRGYSTGKYLTLQVSNIEYGGEGEFVPKTPEQRVATEKEALKVDNVYKAGTVELPTAGETFGNVSISWALAANSVATLADNAITVAALPAQRTNITLTATLTCGEVTDTKEITIFVREPWAALENKVEGITLKTYTELAAIDTATDTNKYYTIGWIVEIENTTYGNAYIQNADGEKFYIYGIKSADGSKIYNALDVKPEIGDVVVLYGQITTYKNNPQMKNGQLMQINSTVCSAGSGNEGGNDEPATPGETVTTIAGAIAADTGASLNLNGTVVAITYAWNGTNCSFDLSDGTNTINVYKSTTEVAVGNIVNVVGVKSSYGNVDQGSTVTITDEGEAPAAPEAPEGTLAASISFADVANRTAFTTEQQVWVQNDITVTNDKAASTSNVADYSNPARFYKSSSLTVEYTGMTAIVFTCNSASYATALQGSIAESADYTVTVNGATVTVTFTAAVNSFNVAALGGQVRMNSIDVYTAEAAE